MVQFAPCRDLSLLLLFLGISNLFGILTDKQEDAKIYHMDAGNVEIYLSVDSGLRCQLEMKTVIYS